jgi:hypothetical protein
MMLHKLRRAMVYAALEPLHGEVEVVKFFDQNVSPGPTIYRDGLQSFEASVARQIYLQT